MLMLPRLACACLILSYVISGAERGDEIRLWPNGAPGSEKETAPEVFAGSDNPKLPKQFTVVHYPSVYAFLPPKEKANGMAVVIAPGGGHSQLVIAKEGMGYRRVDERPRHRGLRPEVPACQGQGFALHGGA